MFYVLTSRQPLEDVGHAGSRLTLHRYCPPPQDASLLNAVRQSLHGGEGHQGVSASVRGRDVPAGLREDDGKELGMCQTGSMPDLLGQGERFLTSLLGLIAIAKPPEDLGYPGEVGGPEMMPSMEGRAGELRGSIEGETGLQVGPGGHE